MGIAGTRPGFPIDGFRYTPVWTARSRSWAGNPGSPTWITEWSMRAIRDRRVCKEPAIRPCRVEPTASRYLASRNLSPGTPQMGHFSGGVPLTVLPHTGHTQIFVSGKSLPAVTASRASPYSP